MIASVLFALSAFQFPRRLQESEQSPECLQGLLGLFLACPNFPAASYDYEGSSLDDLVALCRDESCRDAIQYIGTVCTFDDETDSSALQLLCSGDCDDAEAQQCHERCKDCFEGDEGPECEPCGLCIQYAHCVHDDDDDDKPCFPAEARVQMHSGESASVSSLRVGDVIMAVGSDGGIVRDRVSPLSISNVTGTAHMLRVSIVDRRESLVLTPPHRVAVGRECCGELAPASMLTVGDTVWIRHGNEIAPAQVASVSREERRTTLHSPVLELGNLPLVDGFVTSPSTSANNALLGVFGRFVHSHPALLGLVRRALAHDFPTLWDAQREDGK